MESKNGLSLEKKGKSVKERENKEILFSKNFKIETMFRILLKASCIILI